MGSKKRTIGPVTVALGQVIWALAQERGFPSKSALAAAAAIPEPTLNQITNGRSAIDAEQLAQIAAALGMRTSEVMARGEALAE